MFLILGKVMRKNIYSAILTAILFILPFHAYSDSYNGFEVLDQSENSITIQYISSYSGSKSFSDISGTIFNLPKLDNAQLDIIGTNNFPVFKSKIALLVPSPNGFKAKLLKIIKREIPNYNLSPLPEFLFDKNVDYSSLSKSLTEVTAPDFALEYSGISRRQHLASLIINPVNYDKNMSVLTLIDTMLIRIDFDLSNVNYSRQANEFSSLSAINYQLGKFWTADKEKKSRDIETLQGPEIQTISSLSNGKWGKILIEEEGVYRLDAADLQSIGIQSTPESARTIKIFGKGGKPLSELVSDGVKNEMDEQEIIVRTKSDGSLESVIFYANGTYGFESRNNEIRHYKNFFSDKNYYLVTSGGVDGKRANPLANPDGAVLFRPTTYTERVFVDEDIVNPHSPGAGRDWFGRSFFSSPMSPVMLHDLDRNGEIEYRFAMAHKATESGSFSIFENNQLIGKISLGGISSYTSAIRGFLSKTIPASSISSDNRSIIKFQYDNSLMTAIGYFDYYELAYPRSFFAVGNKVGFIADKGMNGLTEYTINGFSGEIFGFDVSDVKSPKLLTNKAVTGGMYSFCYELSDNKFSKFYISSNLKKPRLELVEIKNLRDNTDNAEIVIITHPDLYASAEKFRDYRMSQSGKKAEIYRTDHIYNEFACGVADPTAIRDFLINIYNRWDVKPQYLVIWGDGHYDFRNISTKLVNYIPAYQTYKNDITAFSEIHEGYATDDFYALIDGDDLVSDINFGRVTVDSPELGDWIVDKIKHYETSQSKDVWRTNMLFIADDGPTSEGYDGTQHTGQSENLQINYISKANPDLQYDKLYLVEYPTIFAGSGRKKPSVTDEMLSRINTTGGLVLNWVGHGNPRVWAHEEILNRDVTIPQMKNIDKLFFLTAATCDFGRFDNPEVRSGAEDMFLSRNGGAIGVFSATRIVYSDDNARLTYAFFSRLLKRNPETGKFPSLGEAINAVKQTFTSTNDRKYFLLGDPTMTLLFPDHHINISTINDIEITDIQDKVGLEALSRVKITGYVSKPSENQPDESYNGTIVVTLRDGDVLMRVQEYVNNKPESLFVYRKLGGNLNKSSYIVENGRFEAEFIIPKDISFSDSLGKLFLYSASDDNRFASGSYHKIMINGFSNVDDRDTTAPEVSIYLDGRKFVSGDIVTENPRLIVDLFDESGINTTGLGIGHKIEAWIDDSPLSIDLTEKFNSSLTDSRRGTVEDILFGLSAGKHKIRIRAWDVFNNFAIAEVFFVIPSANGGLIENILSYPNPFSEGTNIEFRHNAVAPFDVNVEIYTINGVLIRNIKNTLNSLHTSRIFWDGLDDSGNRVADGIYLLNVRLRHESGASLGRGKLVKVGN